MNCWLPFFLYRVFTKAGLTTVPVVQRNLTRLYDQQLRFSISLCQSADSFKL